LLPRRACGLSTKKSKKALKVEGFKEEGEKGVGRGKLRPGL